MSLILRYLGFKETIQNIGQLVYNVKTLIVIEAKMPSQKEKNLTLAENCIAFLHHEFPLGGLNQVSVFRSMKLFEYLTQVQLLKKLRESNKTNSRDHLRAVLLGSGLKAVFCDQIVEVALSELSAIAGDTPVEIVTHLTQQLSLTATL